MREVIKAWHLFEQLQQTNGHRFAVIEGNRNCNRRCSYCNVPQQYNQAQEATVEESYATVDWLHNQGYRLISWLGGEPLAPFKTKENITFFEHTLRVVDYASHKDMVVNVTTNGDYLTEDHVTQLSSAGLDTLTLSFHTYRRPALDHLIRGAKLAAAKKIIPTIQTVLSKETSKFLPTVAATAAEHGVLFSFGVVQEKGGGFSRLSTQESVLPSREDQRTVTEALKFFKSFGFVRNNRNYLEQGHQYYPNNWSCDSTRDTFIHVSAQGRIDVCSDVRTDFHISEIPLLSDSEQWREVKSERVANCGNCLFHCYYEAQNPHILGDLPTTGLIALIKSGQGRLVERWGRIAIQVAKLTRKDIQWEPLL
jgi:MoaA/NifB/PqqE/SkfB family radical SAM enzyme